MKRQLQENSEVTTKKQKTDPAFCKYSCGHICNPEKTNNGDPYDTYACCRQCAKNRNDKNKIVYHDFDCNQRIYNYKIEIGEIEAVNNWKDVNKRIKNKVNEEFGGVLASCLAKKQFINMDIDKIKSILLQYITPQIIPRPFWKPKTQQTDQNISIIASKYGGKPLLYSNEEWPKCGNCTNYMPLFVQLNVNNLPNKFKQKFLPKNKNGAILWENHLIQLFYCGNADNCDDGADAFNNQHTQRLIAIPSADNEYKYKEEEYLDEIMKIIEEKSENGELDWQNKQFIISEWTENACVEAATYGIESELTETFSMERI